MNRHPEIILSTTVVLAGSASIYSSGGAYILASPYFDGVHRGVNLVPAHVGYDGSGNATRFRTVFHAPNGFSLPVDHLFAGGMLNFPRLRK